VKVALLLARAYLLGRLKEASTWRGIILFATAYGAHVNEQQAVAIISLGVGFAGLVGAMFPDSPTNPKELSK
jgi:hypothetical protein